MDISKSIFRRKKVNFEKLTAFGFSKEEGTFSYRAALSGSGFILTVRITAAGIPHEQKALDYRVSGRKRAARRDLPAA